MIKEKYEEDLVSIIMPSYNSEIFIWKSINSVLQQSYENWELIIVDDFSLDNTLDNLKQNVIDKRIKIIGLNSNMGAAFSRNEGLKIARGQFIAFLDSDDIWEKDKLKLQIDFMKKNDIGFSYTSYKRVSEKTFQLRKVVPVIDKVNYSGLLKNTLIACSTVCINRSITGEFLMPMLRKGQDTATWLLLLKRVPYAYGLNVPLTSYVVRSESISSNKFLAAKRTWNLYRKNEKINIFKSIYYFICYGWNATTKRL